MWCDMELSSAISYQMEIAMTLSRRRTLALIGGGVILAATGSLGAIATRQPRTAMLPWGQAGQG